VIAKAEDYAIQQQLGISGDQIREFIRGEMAPELEFLHGGKFMTFRKQKK
jgi:hypothetical protein